MRFSGPCEEKSSGSKESGTTSRVDWIRKTLSAASNPGATKNIGVARGAKGNVAVETSIGIFVSFDLFHFKISPKIKKNEKIKFREEN